MKINSLSTIERIVDPSLENKINKEHQRLKELAIKNARHLAQTNKPDHLDEDISPYAGDIKAGYEKLASEVFISLQPSANIPEGKMDIDLYKEKDKHLDEEIKTKEHLNHQDQYDLGDFNSHDIPVRMKWALISTLLITIGEIVYNTKAFQVTGENLLFSLIISIGLSFCVFLFSHAVPLLIKHFKERWLKWSIGAGSFVFVTIVFIALAIFRTSYLAGHGVNINPIFFVIINLFFFIVSVLISFFLLPTWLEIKEYRHKAGINKKIQGRKKEIEFLKEEKVKNKDILNKVMKARMRIMHYAIYYADLIKKMYWETLAIFKSTNMNCRQDMKIPNCFLQPMPEPNISENNIPIFNKLKS